MSFTQALGPIGPRIAAAFRTWPGVKGWVETAVIGFLFTAVALPLGLFSDFLSWQSAPLEAGAFAAVLVITFFVPSLFEETLFRAMLLPRTGEPGFNLRTRTGWDLFGLVVFVAMHPLNALLFRPEARPVFCAPVFLALAALLGAACTLAFRRTNSVWPPVVLHWLAVVCWKAFLGGSAGV